VFELRLSSILKFGALGSSVKLTVSRVALQITVSAHRSSKSCDKIIKMKSVFLLVLFSLLNYAASQTDQINKTQTGQINKTIDDIFSKPNGNTDAGGIDDKLLEDIFGKPDGASNATNPDPIAPIDLTPSGGGTVAGTDSCECVPYYLCNNNTIITSGYGVVSIRIDDGPCEYLSVCCSKPNQRGREDPIIRTRNPSKPEGCGSRNPEGVDFQITGGKDNEAQFGEFPWMVALLREEGNTEKYQCGAALIHPQVVLTSAHCVTCKDTQYKIRAGEWDTRTKDEPLAHQDRNVKTVIIHPQYKPPNLFNDVAVLILESPLEMAENVDVICLPKQGFVIDEARCFASGWGKDVFGKEGTYQVILKKFELPIVPRNICQDHLRTTRLGKYFELHSSFICAGGEPGKDTCTGDGGSPLVCPIPDLPGRYVQVGIVDWGIGCGENHIPGVYANVGQFSDWIDEQLASNNFDMPYKY